MQTLILKGETEQSRLPSTSQGKQEPVEPQTKQKGSNKNQKDRQKERERHIKLHSLGGQVAIYKYFHRNTHLILEKDLSLGKSHSNTQLINVQTQGRMFEQYSNKLHLILVQRDR